MVSGYTQMNATEQRVLARVRGVGYGNKDVQKAFRRSKATVSRYSKTKKEVGEKLVGAPTEIIAKA